MAALSAGGRGYSGARFAAGGGGEVQPHPDAREARMDTFMDRQGVQQ
jgi:hypothetical protein